MNQSNYDQFNYDNYNQPKKSGFGSLVGAVFRNPIYATSAILLMGVILAAVIILGYSSDDKSQDAPIIVADAEPYKIIPDDPQGLDIPYAESEIYAGLRDVEPSAQPSDDALNAQEAVMNDFEILAQKSAELAAGNPDNQSETVASTRVENLIEQATGVQSIPDAQGGDTLDAIIAKVEEKNVSGTDNTLKTLDIPVNEDSTEPASQETIDFVKNVLASNETEGDSNVTPQAKPQATQTARDAAAITPAAGGFDIRPVDHFVQLGSIKDASAASAEWAKLTKKYGAELSAAKYRVQRADLGDRGVFFRIQAGPMSKDSASEICGSIKAQTPGGCLVTR